MTPSPSPGRPDLEPDIVEGDDCRMAHLMWAMFEEDDQGDDAHIGYWATSDGRLIIQSFQSNSEIRGRDMLVWLQRYRLPIHVVEVIPPAIGFWEKMQREGLIADWDHADGEPSPLESLSIPLSEPGANQDNLIFELAA